MSVCTRTYLSRIAIPFLLAVVSPSSGKKHNDFELTSNELSRPLVRSFTPYRSDNNLLPGNIKVFYHSGVSKYNWLIFCQKIIHDFPQFEGVKI